MKSTKDFINERRTKRINKNLIAKSLMFNNIVPRVSKLHTEIDFKKDGSLPITNKTTKTTVI